MTDFFSNRLQAIVRHSFTIRLCKIWAP